MSNNLNTEFLCLELMKSKFDKIPNKKFRLVI